ncbi:MAG TPA: tetratricopeptide repeat protein [Steroidobacteraceae bacterium]|nr:tetratricopeptide repeat protein [Steroidobacteraceae bacterium]
MLRLSALLCGWVAVACAGAERAATDLAELKAAAERGDAAAEEQYGTARLGGYDGAEIDLEDARHWFELAAKGGRRGATAALAYMLKEGQGGPADLPRAAELNRVAALQGVAASQSRLAYEIESGPQPDHALAMRLLEAAGAQGDTYALQLLSYHYGNGVNVTRDVPRAFNFALRAAQLGDRDAEVFAANYLITEKKEPQAQRRGFALLEDGASSGHGPAMFSLGWHYWAGVRRPRDGAQAARWLASAVQAGQMRAGLWLAQCYATGFGVERNTTRAELLFARSEAAAGASGMNQFAWQLAVAPSDDLRDGARAVRIMQQALQLPDARRPAYLDTLAAALAETGDYAGAIRAQLEAIAALGPNASASARTVFDQRLALYRDGKPYREPL